MIHDRMIGPPESEPDRNHHARAHGIRMPTSSGRMAICHIWQYGFRSFGYVLDDSRKPSLQSQHQP